MRNPSFWLPSVNTSRVENAACVRDEIAERRESLCTLIFATSVSRECRRVHLRRGACLGVTRRLWANGLVELLRIGIPTHHTAETLDRVVEAIFQHGDARAHKSKVVVIAFGHNLAVA